ncbi:VanW family protein [Microbispora sp. NEAU-D428]|uniref:VanW family protein n=1 Tax=Microbispora sitophila TaxID=2771537 RepID=UPI00186647AF|nr:VanW family protein [Microbispora sitophila]MBE3007693.1 VanW family protein [Microbispora sitophila]
MRNAGASVDPPTDPSGAASAPPHKHPVRRVTSLPRGVSALPRGVSADIFAEPPAPAAPAVKPSGNGNLPPPAPPVEPWRVPERPASEEPVVVPPPDLELLDPVPQSRTLRRALIGLAVLLLALYLVPAASMAGKVLPGTMVLGVDIGGQSRAEAAATLRERLYAQARTPLIVRQGTRRLTVDPQQAGLMLDAEATALAAPGGFPSPLEVWSALTGTREVKPVVSVDRRKLDEAVARDIAAPLEHPGREGDVSFDGVIPVPTYPRVGRVIDRRATADQIVRGYLDPEAVVVVPTSRDLPHITRAEVRRALRWARRAVAAPLTLTNGTTSVSLSPATLARHLTFAPDGAVLRPRFDAEAAVAGVEPALVGTARAARDATFTIKAGRPVLVPGRPGDRVDTDRLAADVLTALDGGGRAVAVSVVNGPPRVTDDAAQRMGVREEIGRFTTSYACCPQSAGNIRAAAALLDGRLVEPGETFSFNEVVGPRTAAAGFDGIGPTMIRGRAGTEAAGMTQVATTLMNAVIRAGLRVAEHTPPEFHASHLPIGTEAAVSFPGPDLRWKNDSPYGVLVQASATGTSLTVTLWSTKRYDVDLQGPVVGQRVSLPAVTGHGSGCVATQGQPGFTAAVTRVLRQDGEVVSRQTFRTSYVARAGVVCG